MRYPSLVFLSSTLPFLPWLDVGWLSACTRRPPLYPGLSSENSKPPVDEQREGERERDNRERRTKNGETQSGHEHKTEYRWRKGRTIPGISVDQPTPRERGGHATKHRIKRPKFQGGTADSYLLPIDVRLFPTGFQLGCVQSGVVAFKGFISSFDTFEEARGNCS